MVKRKLYKLKISCNTINARIIKRQFMFQNDYVAIMDYMSGPLSKMSGKLKIRNIFNVIKDIAIITSIRAKIIRLFPLFIIFLD